MSDQKKDQLPRLYREIPDWWPVLSAPEDYAGEAEFYRQAILSASHQRPETLLELGSGGGNNASHMKKHFTMTLVDLSPGMLAVSRKLNPECEHLQGDMRSLRLERQFDAVFIHDAIDYLTSLDDLRQALQTASLHCKPGGVSLFVPDFVRETFKPCTSHGGEDREGRSLRYLEWTYDPDPSDSIYTNFMVYILRQEGKSPVVIEDEHICGLFSRADWLRLIDEAGFKAGWLPFNECDAVNNPIYVFLGLK